MSLFDQLLRYLLFYKMYSIACDLYADHLVYILLQWYYLSARIKKKSKKTILFYPEKPHRYHVVYQICLFNNFDIINSPKKADAVMYFEDTTLRKYDTVIQKINKKYSVINYRCRDISKQRVEEVHRKIFGYGLSINPRTFKGKYVKKGNANSLHDAVILNKPENPQKGYVYQLLVNTKVDDELVEIRLPVIGTTIPLAYLKHHPLRGQFDGINKRIKMVRVEDVVAPDEYTKILAFCREFGLDYGELDVLRDIDTKRLYIVDANNTPAGPPYLLSLWDYAKALQIMSDAFQQSFLW